MNPQEPTVVCLTKREARLAAAWYFLAGAEASLDHPDDITLAQRLTGASS